MALRGYYVSASAILQLMYSSTNQVTLITLPVHRCSKHLQRLQWAICVITIMLWTSGTGGEIISIIEQHNSLEHCFISHMTDYCNNLLFHHTELILFLTQMQTERNLKSCWPTNCTENTTRIFLLLSTQSDYFSQISRFTGTYSYNWRIEHCTSIGNQLPADHWDSVTDIFSVTLNHFI